MCAPRQRLVSLRSGAFRWGILGCALVALAAGCDDDDGSGTGDGPTDNTTEPTGDTATEPVDTELTGEPWLKRDHEGSVVVRQELSYAMGNGDVELYGLFVDDLQGASTGLWCMDRGVCFDELSVDEEMDIGGVFRRGLSDYDWVGETVTIGNDPRLWVNLPFVADAAANFGVYRSTVDEFDEDEVPPYRVSFDGEWDEVELDDAVQLPLLPRLRTPSPDEVQPRSTEVEFSWEWPPADVLPRGQGRLYIRVMSNQVDRMIPLPDEEGPYTLELEDWGLNPSSNVDFYFGRWTRKQEIVTGNNELTVWGVVEQPVTTVRCSGARNFNLDEEDGHVHSQTGVVLEVDQVSMAFEGVVDRAEIYDWRDQPDPKLPPEERTAELVFDLYDIDGNRCAYTYDATASEPRPTFASDSGALVQQAFQLQPSGGSLRVDCDAGLLEVSYTDGADPIVIDIAPGVVETGTATLNQRSATTRETPKTEAGMHRLDRVYIGINGIEVVQGNEVPVKATPSPPTVPANSVPLAMLLVEGNNVVEMDDERVFTDRMPEDAPVTSVRSLIETRVWSYGFGESLRHQSDPGVAPERVWGFFSKHPDEETGVEIGAGVANHLTDCFFVGPGSGPVPYASGAPITGGVYQMQGYSTFGFEFPEPTGLTGHTGDTGSGTGSTGDTGP